jgi:GT2 family glycosyltransferase
MLVSIIIVNYKSSHYIMDCLASAQATLIANEGIEWIVVDNASGDESRSLITKAYPFVQWIQMDYNAGFARANNAGIKMAKGEAVLLLNPDTLLLPGAIEKVGSQFLHSNHVACGVQLVHADMTPQFSGSYFVKGGLNHLLALPYWGSTLKAIASLFKKTKPAIVTAGKEQEVDWISGAFLMVKKWAIAKAGLLDEDFFLYAEEVEWCSRLKKLGTLCLYGDIQIIHLIGGTIQEATNSADNSYTNLADLKGFQLMVSNHVRIRKQYGIFWFLVQLLNFTWAVLYAFIASFLYQLLHFKNPFFEFVAIGGLAKNVIKLWVLLPTIIMGNTHFYKCI